MFLMDYNCVKCFRKKKGHGGTGDCDIGVRGGGGYSASPDTIRVQVCVVEQEVGPVYKARV